MPIFQTGSEALLLGVELNNYCNLRCVHCLRNLKDKPKQFPVDLLLKILREAKPLGAKIVGFTGGEPTLHPKLGEILEIVKNEGYRCYFVTNAGRFEIVKKLFVNYKDIIAGISFSLDGAVKETHDFIRGEGSFMAVMTAIAACYGEGVPFSLQMCLNNQNKDEISAMALLAVQLGAKQLFYALSIPTPALVSKGLLLSPAECLKVERQVNLLKSSFSFDIYMAIGYSVNNPFFHCRAMNMSALNFDYAGNLTVCCQLSNYVGNFKGFATGRGGAGGTDTNSAADIAASMTEVSLMDGMTKLQDTLNKFLTEKIKHVQCGFKDVDTFPCIYCAKWYGKLDWLQDIKDNPWN